MVEKTRRELLEEAFDESERENQAGDSEGGDGGNAEHGQERATGAFEESQPDIKADGEGGAGEGGEGGEQRAEGEVDETGKQKPSKVETPDAKERRAAAEAAQRTEATRAASRATDRPPNSWKPAEREEWAKIPPSARAAIARRETEIQRELSSTATIRKFSGELANIVHPHMQTMQAMNTTPLAAIDTLLKTASSLYRGSPEEKARIIVDVMKSYGVDVRVLDKVLSGQPLPPELVGKGRSADGGAPPSWAQPIFDFMNKATTAQAERNMQMEVDAQTEIAQAETTMPFLSDLKDDVADILEFAAKRSKVMTLQEAYDRAVQLDPTVSQIVSQRAAAARQRNGGGGNLAAKRAAAKTVSGAPRGGAAPGRGGSGKQSRREAIEQAWDDAE
jgi:hypothetical protein